MQLKRSKWGDVKWVGVGSSGYALLTEGPRRPYAVQYTSNDQECYVEKAEHGGWNVIVLGEIVDHYQLKVNAQATLLEYLV